MGTTSTTSRSPTEIIVVATGLALLVAGCKSKPADPLPAPSATAIVDAGPPAPLWIDDDYAAALAKAKAEHKLLFVDAWATWCHTCRSMRAFVLTPNALPAERFVFAAIDTERPENAAACAKLPLTVLPTFFVVNPEGEAIVSRWEGAASSSQLRAFFDDAWAIAHGDDGSSLTPYRSALRDGDRAEASGNHEAAAKSYASALSLAPADWPRRPDVLVLEIGALARAKDYRGCVELARSAHAGTGRSSSATDFATVALDCEDKGSGRDAALEADLTTQLVALSADEAAPLSADDRADAFRLVWELRERAGDLNGAKQSARDRLALLDRAATQVTDPEIASTFDGARLETLLYLERAKDAVTFFEAREQALPKDYNTSYRLGKALFAAGRNDDALAAADRALGLAYGARKGQIHGFRADVLVRLGRTKEAKEAVAAELALYRGLPEGQRHPAVEKAVADRLAKM